MKINTYDTLLPHIQAGWEMYEHTCESTEYVLATTVDYVHFAVESKYPKKTVMEALLKYLETVKD